MAERQVLIEVKDLKKYFKVGKNAVLKAVDGVNFKIYKGETLPQPEPQGEEGIHETGTDHFPGSLLVSESQDDGRRHHRGRD